MLFFVTLGLGRRNLFVLPVVFDIVGIEDLLHHLIDGIEDGVVIDFKVFEDGIEVGVGFEDVVVGASNAGEGTLKLLVCALLQKPEGVLFGKRWQFDIFDVLHPN